MSNPETPAGNAGENRKDRADSIGGANVPPMERLPTLPPIAHPISPLNRDIIVACLAKCEQIISGCDADLAKIPFAILSEALGMLGAPKAVWTAHAAQMSQITAEVKPSRNAPRESWEVTRYDFAGIVESAAIRTLMAQFRDRHEAHLTAGDEVDQ